MIRLILAIMQFVCVGVPMYAASPEETVRWIYTSSVDPAPNPNRGLEYLSSPEQRQSYFSRRMVAFYAANDTHGDDLATACVDFNFIIPGQDYDADEIMRTLRLSTSGDANRTSVTADFVTFGQPAQVVFSFIAQDGFWKIDDIAGQGFRVSEIPCEPKAAATAIPARSFCYQNGDDSLRLDLDEDTSARIDLTSWQANGHSCSASQVGRAVEGGWDFSGVEGCNLQLRVTADQGLVLSDPEWACKAHMCGQRAVMDGLQFPRSSQVDCTAWRGNN